MSYRLSLPAKCASLFWRIRLIEVLEKLEKLAAASHVLLYLYKPEELNVLIKEGIKNKGIDLREIAYNYAASLCLDLQIEILKIVLKKAREAKDIRSGKKNF